MAASSPAAAGARPGAAADAAAGPQRIVQQPSAPPPRHLLQSHIAKAGESAAFLAQVSRFVRAHTLPESAAAALRGLPHDKAMALMDVKRMPVDCKPTKTVSPALMERIRHAQRESGQEPFKLEAPACSQPWAPSGHHKAAAIPEPASPTASRGEQNRALQAEIAAKIATRPDWKPGSRSDMMRVVRQRGLHPAFDHLYMLEEGPALDMFRRLPLLHKPPDTLDDTMMGMVTLLDMDAANLIRRAIVLSGQEISTSGKNHQEKKLQQQQQQKQLQSDQWWQQYEQLQAGMPSGAAAAGANSPYGFMRPMWPGPGWPMWPGIQMMAGMMQAAKKKKKKKKRKKDSSKKYFDERSGKRRRKHSSSSSYDSSSSSSRSSSRPRTKKAKSEARDENDDDRQKRLQMLLSALPGEGNPHRGSEGEFNGSDSESARRHNGGERGGRLLAGGYDPEAPVDGHGRERSRGHTHHSGSRLPRDGGRRGEDSRDNPSYERSPGLQDDVPFEPALPDDAPAGYEDSAPSPPGTSMLAWLRGLDAGRGAFEQYHEVLVHDFGAEPADLKMARVAGPPGDGAMGCIDPTFWEVSGITSPEHRAVLAAAIRALPE